MAEHRASIQPCRPDGQNPARVPSPTQPEAQPLCLVPAGKQEAYPFVAVAGLVKPTRGPERALAVFFHILKNAPPPG